MDLNFVLSHTIAGLSAGFVLNWLADTLPLPWQAQTQRATWKRTLRQQPNRLRTFRGLAVLLMALLLCFHAGWSNDVTAPGIGDLLRYFYLQIFLLIAVIDLEHRRVLNGIVAGTVLVALVSSLFIPSSSLLNVLLGGFSGLSIFILIALLRPGAMGAGDVKLAALIGMIAGFPGILVALAIGILAGGIGATLVLLTKQGTRHATMAYAPYLSIGGAVALLHSTQIITWYMQRFMA